MGLANLSRSLTRRTEVFYDLPMTNAHGIIRADAIPATGLSEIVRIVAAANGWTLGKLAKEAGVDPADLSRLDTDADRAMPRRLIARALGVEDTHGDRP